MSQMVMINDYGDKDIEGYGDGDKDKEGENIGDKDNDVDSDDDRIPDHTH